MQAFFIQYSWFTFSKKYEPLILFISLLFSSQINHSQNTSKLTYTMIQIEGQYDKVNKRYCCRINAESIGNYSKEITSLVSYNINKDAINTGASFYFEKNDTASVYYNYFLNTIEAFSFLPIINGNW